MFQNPIITSFIPTTNPQLSKRFYEKTLGLKLISEDDFALEFQGHGSILRITIVHEFTPQTFAVLGFVIKDIVAEVKNLKSNNLEFEIYASLNQDELGVWTSPSKAKVAWFKDPEGNLLSLTQYP